MSEKSPKELYLEILRKKAKRKAEAELESQKKSEEEKKSKTKKVTWMYNFIEQFNIRPGTHKVPNNVLFYWFRNEYKPSRKDHNNKSKIHFFREFSKYFQSGRKTGERFYYLNKDSFGNLTRTVKEKANHYEQVYKKELEEKKQREKKEKKRHLTLLKQEFKSEE